jgi:hypothetical protein
VASFSMNLLCFCAVVIDSAPWPIALNEILRSGPQG